MVFVLWLGLAGPSVAGVVAPALTSVHGGRDATWAWQRAAGACCTSYDWVADRPSTSSARRWHLAKVWWARAANAHAYYEWWQSQQPAAGGVPAWFAAAMPCLAQAEEGGSNSWAGYFGMVSPPSAYPGSSGAVAAYGDSWLAIPWAAQVGIVWAEWLAYGSAPWPNTAPECGL